MLLEIIAVWAAAAIIANVAAEVPRWRSRKPTPTAPPQGHVCQYSGPCAACNEEAREAGEGVSDPAPAQSVEVSHG